MQYQCSDGSINLVFQFPIHILDMIGTFLVEGYPGQMIARVL